jgi:hypothetical protein
VFGVGGGALISRLLGAAEHEPAQAGEIKRVSSFAFWGAVILGAVVGGVGLLLLHPLVSLLGANAAALHATRVFVAVMLAFVPVLAAAVCLEQLVRAEGAARQVMIGLIASTVANLGFDVLFILLLHWGVAGAALSTGLTNLVTLAYFATWLHRHSKHISLAPRWFTLSPTVLKPARGHGRRRHPARPSAKGSVRSLQRVRKEPYEWAGARNRSIASGVIGVKRLMRLPSGSRNSRDRLPHGIVVGSCTRSSSSSPFSRSNSASTSATWNSMITVRFAPGWAMSAPNAARVGVPATASVPALVRSSANWAAPHAADRPVTCS